MNWDDDDDHAPDIDDEHKVTNMGLMTMILMALIQIFGRKDVFYNYDGGLDYVDDLSCDDVDNDDVNGVKK